MYPIIIGTEPASSGSECLGNQRHVAIVGCQCPVSRRWDVPPETISHEMMQKMGLVWFGHVWKMVSWCPMRYGLPMSAIWQFMKFMGGRSGLRRILPSCTSIIEWCAEAGFPNCTDEMSHRRCKGQRIDSSSGWKFQMAPGSTISTLAALWQAYINLLRFAAWKAGHQPQF